MPHGFTDRPSAKLDPAKAASPFSGGVKGRTKFSVAYGSGRIPVRIDHFGTGRNRIQWDVPLGRVSYPELLPVCAEGLRETVHPHCFVAKQMFKEMVEASDASSKVVPLLPVVARAVKAALMDEACFEVGMEAVRQVAGCVGPAITPHVQDLCSQLAKKALDARAKDAVWRTLQILEEAGGPEAYAAIKRKVPTYTSVRM